jgi:hypothetical protein
MSAGPREPLHAPRVCRGRACLQRTRVGP